MYFELNSYFYINVFKYDEEQQSHFAIRTNISRSKVWVSSKAVKKEEEMEENSRKQNICLKTKYSNYIKELNSKHNYTKSEIENLIFIHLFI